MALKNSHSHQVEGGPNNLTYLGMYVSITAPVYEATETLDPVTRMQTVDCYTWLPGDILMKADKMSMAHSLELRVPFLDVEVFELARTVPARYKVAQGTTKLALRQAFRNLLPPEVFNRPKLGFPIPIRHWIQHEYRDFVLDVFRQSPVEYFDRSYLELLADDYRIPVVNRDRKVWTLLVFLLWHQIFIEGAWKAF